MKTINYTGRLVPCRFVPWLFSFLFLVGFSMVNLHAQLAINYPLTISNGSYNSISETGNALPTLAADNGQQNITGLTPGFTVNGVTYTNARMSSNGWLMLYTSAAPSSNTESGILNTSTSNAGVILAPFNSDLHTSYLASTAVYYGTIGDEHIFEWKNFSRYNFTESSRTDILNFQIRLNTATGAISFVYGDITVGSTLTQSIQVGWKTNPTNGSNWATDINNLMLDAAGSPNTCTWSDVVTGNSNTSSLVLNSSNPLMVPASGLTYTWTPQAAPAPVRTFSAVTGIGAYGATITWTAPAGATQYNVRYRAVGSCNWTNWSGNPVMSNSVTLTGLSPLTTYQVQVQASNGTNNSIWSHIPNSSGGGNGYTSNGTFTTLASCFPPTALTPAPTGVGTANISWTAPVNGSPIGYEYAVTNSPTPPASGTFVSGTSTSLSGLTGNVFYLHVRTDCGDGDYSVWSTSSAFVVDQPNQIGNGSSTTGSLPIVSNFGYNYSQQIYTSSEYSAVYGTSNTYITKIRFYYNGSSSGIAPGSSTPTASFQDWTIYMGNTTKNAFSGTSDWIPSSSMTEVFSGQVTFPAPGSWMEITLSSPFVWNGTDNIVVAVDENTSGYGSLVYFRAFTASNRGIYYRNDTNNPDPSSPPTAFAVTSSINQIQFEVSEPPACLPPLSLSVSNITATGADFSWSASTSNPENGYEWEVRDASDNVVASGTTSGTTASASSLTPNTSGYKLYVKSICGDEDESDWIASSAFTTPCAPATVPYIEDFESVTVPQLPVCTQVIQAGSGSLWKTVSSAGFGFNTKCLQYSWNSSNAANTWFFTRSVTLQGGVSYRISYNYGGSNYTEKLKVAYGTTATVAGMTTVIADYPSITGSTPQLAVIDFTPVSDGDYYFGFHAYSAANQNNLMVDNIKVELTPSCETPTAVVVTNVTSTSADISWSAPALAPDFGYEYVVSTSSTPPSSASDTGTEVAGTSTTVTTLSPNTTYYVFVRSECIEDEDYSEWVISTAFTTTQIPVSSYPYLEDAETDMTEWTFMNGTQVNKWAVGTATNNGGTKALYISNNNGVSNSYTNTSTSVVQVYRDFTIPAEVAAITLEFDWKSVAEAGCCDYFRVFVVPTSFIPTPGTQITTTGTAPNGRVQLGGNFMNSVSYTHAILPIPVAYAGTTFRLVFEWRNDSGSGNNPPAAIDNIEMKLTTCHAPSNPIASVVGINSANFSWAAASPAPVNGYEWVLRDSGNNVVDSGTTFGTTASSSLLTPNTSGYVFSVRSLCEDEESIWVNSTSFSTPVWAAMPWQETFSVSSTPNGWSVTSFSVSNSSSGTNNGGASTYYMYKNLYSGATSGSFTALLVGPLTVDAVLSFDYKLSNYSSPYGPPAAGSGSFTVQLSTDFGATYTTLETLVNDGVTTGWQTRQYNLTAYTGQYIKLRIEATRVSGDYNLAFDNFQIASCYPPTNLAVSNLTATGATFSWSAPSVAGIPEGYVWEIRTSGNGGDPSPAFSGTSATTSSNMIGLTPETTYRFWVRTDCGDGEISYWSSVPFTTPASCPIPTNITTIASLTSASASWDDPGFAVESWEIEYGVAPLTPTGIPNVVGITENSYEFTSLSQTTNYVYYLRANCGAGNSAWVGPFSFQTLPCEPTYTTGKTSGDLLSRVRILGTTLDNESGIAQTNPAYTFFTGQTNYTATLNAGTSYTIEVSIGTYGSQGVAVWIDFNGNGIFETPEERIGYTNGTFGVGTGGLPISPQNTTTFTITLPCSPEPGIYRMRVRDVWNQNGQTIDPCMSYGYGETEDYEVTIAPPPPCPAPTAGVVTSITSSGAVFDWNIGCEEELWNVHVTTAGGGAPTGAPSHPNVTKPLSVSALSAFTDYEFYIQSICEEDVSTWIGPFTFKTKVVNDDCAGAIELPMNAGYGCGTYVSGTTVESSQSSAPTPSCSAIGIDDDVWFRFTATHTNHRLQLTNVSGSTGMAMAVYSGSCGALVQVQCSSLNTLDLTGLVPSQQYYVRVWTSSSSPSISATFNICVGAPLPPPANDNCANPIAFPTISTNSTCASVTVNTEWATSSGIASCTGTADDDVWFTFTVPVGYSSLLYQNTNISGSTDRVLQVFSTCDGSSLGCYDPEIGIITGLTGGSTYLLRAYTYGNGVISQFKICLRVPPPVPANDECVSATVLTVNPDYNCGVTTNGTTSSATQSAITPTCSGSGINDDVWYQFTATHSQHRITLTNISDGNAMAIALYSGSCGSLSQVNCVTSSALNATGLVPSQTYYVRVWTTSSTPAIASSFTICVGSPPPPPVNDDCENAIALTLGQPYTGTVVSATQSMPAIACGSFTGYADDDVWFSFVAPGAPVDIFATGIDGVIDLRTGSCNGTNVACADQYDTSDLISGISLVEGQTYYIRYYSYLASQQFDPYTIIVKLSEPPAPANDEPSSSSPVIFNAQNTYPNCVQVHGTTEGATPSVFLGENDIWYRFTAQTNGVSIRLESVFIDGVLSLYDSDLELLDFEDAIWEAGGTEILNYGDLVPGNQYFLSVANYMYEGAMDGPFTLCLQHLDRPKCSPMAPQTLCSYVNAGNHTAYSTTFSFTDSNEVVHTHTTTSPNIQLSHASLGLRYNETYTMSLVSNYRLENGLGITEMIQVPGFNTCEVTILDHSLIGVHSNQRCSSGAQLARTALLTNQVISGSGLCSVIGYRIEFTPVSNCAGDNPNEAGKFERTISSPNTGISLNYAFNHLPESSNPNVGYWSVRWKPRFSGYEGTYGPAYVIAVKKTAGSPAMALDNNGASSVALSELNDITANVYPNPNNGELVNLNVTGITGNEVYVRIMDSMGREVYTNRYTAEGSLNTIVNFTQPLAQGVYMVEFKDGERVVTQRMMVSK